MIDFSRKKFTCDIKCQIIRDIHDPNSRVTEVIYQGWTPMDRSDNYMLAQLGLLETWQFDAGYVYAVLGIVIDYGHHNSYSNQAWSSNRRRSPKTGLIRDYWHSGTDKDRRLV